MIRNVPATNPRLRDPARIQKFAEARDVMATVNKLATKVSEQDQARYDLDPTPDVVTVHKLSGSGRFDSISGVLEREDQEKTSFMSVSARDFGRHRGSFYSESYVTLEDQGDRIVYKHKRGKETQEVYHDLSSDTLVYFTRDAKGRFR